MSEEDVVVDTPNESEVKARQIGWVSQDEFKGDPEQWRDADEFLKRGEEIHGFLKKDLEKLQSKLSQRDKEIAEIRSTMDEFRQFHNETESRAYKRALDDLKQAKVKAIEQGDGEQVIQIDDEIDKIKEAQQKPAQKEHRFSEKQQNQINQEYREWLPDNKWYVEDQELQLLADDLGEVIKKNSPNLVGKAFLDEVTKKVRRAAPDKFENPARNYSAVGTSSDNRTVSNKKKRSYNDLPAEAKSACDKFVKQKLMSQEQYLAEYDWS